MARAKRQPPVQKRRTRTVSPYTLKKRTGYCWHCMKNIEIIPNTDRMILHSNRKRKSCSGSNFYPMEIDGDTLKWAANLEVNDNAK